MMRDSNPETETLATLEYAGDGAAGVVCTLANPLGDEHVRGGSLQLVCFSGWAGDGDPFAAQPDPMCWSGSGFEALKSWVSALGGGRFLIRPHHAHVVSDVPTCKAFVSELCRSGAGAEDRAVGLALDPALMLAPSMVDRAEDHAVRMADFAGSTEDLAALVVTGLKARPDGVLVPCSLRDPDSVLTPGVFEPIFSAMAGRRVPILTVPGDSEHVSGLARAGGVEPESTATVL